MAVFVREGGLEAENPCFGIIVHVFTEVAGLVVIATDQNYPPDVSFWLFRV